MIELIIALWLILGVGLLIGLVVILLTKGFKALRWFFRKGALGIALLLALAGFVAMVAAP